MNRDRDAKLPQTNYRIPMPKTKEFGEKICMHVQRRMYESSKRYFGY